MSHSNYRRFFLATIVVAFAGCGDDGGGPLGGLTDGGNPLGNTLKVLGEQCGIDVDCKAGGIAEGNASISGVASIDAFFASVLSFQAKAGGVSAALDAEVQAIAADFGVSAGATLKADLQAKIMASFDGGLTIDYQPAECAVDAHATLEAQARCDASVDPGSAMVECKGSCEVEASATVDCGASAQVECTFTAPSAMCEGTCKGSCDVELTAAASCEGTCTGTCSGTCSAYAKDGAGNAQCAGKCDGMCMGSCKAELAAGASCSGKCEGECTVTPPDGNCEGAVHASCKADANAMVMCSGSCKGDFEPPMAKAECQASAKADAKLNVECSPPRVAISYKLNASLDATAQAQMVAAVKNLEVRLPRLLAAFAKANMVVDAGEGLAASASGAVSASIDAAGKAAGEGDLKVFFGLQCAAGQIDAVSDALSGASTRLTGSVKAAGDLTGALGM